MKLMLYSLSAVCGNLEVGGVVGEKLFAYGVFGKNCAPCAGVAGIKASMSRTGLSGDT